MDSTAPHVSFIGIVDFSEEARWLYCSASISDLLGYEPNEVIGRPSLELVHPDEFTQVRQLHYDTISLDKAAVIVYIRMRHKDPYKGYVLCAVSRTVVRNVLVGSVSNAQPGPKSMHTASTAQEITVITPNATDLEFRRWGDPSPMPPESLPSSTKKPTRTGAISYDPLPEQSSRTALILDRFSRNCPILYCSNNEIVDTVKAMGRSFFDFVTKKDEELVRSYIDCVKSWGVNERGQPSDGGFGFGKFHFFPAGRDSSATDASSPAPSRHRHGPHSSRRPSRAHTHSPTSQRPSLNSRATSVQEPGMQVDSIFSAHSDGLVVILRPKGDDTAFGR